LTGNNLTPPAQHNPRLCRSHYQLSTDLAARLNTCVLPDNVACELLAEDLFKLLQNPVDRDVLRESILLHWLLKDIRADIIAKGNVVAEKIIQEFESIPLGPRPEESIQACNIGVGH